MKHIRTYGTGALLGSLSVVLMNALTGCSAQEESINQSKFIIVQETAPGKFEVIEETPINGPTRIMVKNLDGSMRELTPEEMKTLAQEEYAKVQNGTSETTQPSSGEGMGLAGTILAVAAGSILGNMIANQLMGNKNFAQNNRAHSAHARSVNRPSTPAVSNTQKKSFFGKTGTSQNSTPFGG